MASYEYRIYNAAIGDNIPHDLANLIVAQAKHETDDFSSHAFFQNNNCFGYKYTPQSSWASGPGIPSSEHNSYADYKCIEDSVHELTHWIYRRQKQAKFPTDLSIIDTPIEYATYLKNCLYYGDSIRHYVDGLSYFSGDYSNYT